MYVEGEMMGLEDTHRIWVSFTCGPMHELLHSLMSWDAVRNVVELMNCMTHERLCLSTAGAWMRGQTVITMLCMLPLELTVPC